MGSNSGKEVTDVGIYSSFVYASVNRPWWLLLIWMLSYILKRWNIGGQAGNLSPFA